MEATSIETFLRGLGCDRVAIAGAWVRGTCPLSRWRHSGGRDKRPSFGVAVSSGTSNGNCFACGWKGSLLSLLWYLDDRGQDVDRWWPFLVSRDQPEFPDEAVQKTSKIIAKVRSSSYWGPEVPHVSKYSAPLDPEPVFKVIPEERLQGLRRIPKSVLKYLEKDRKLSLSAVNYWELGYSERMHRVVIPIRKDDGTLVAMSGRALGSNKPKYLHYPKGFSRNRILYGGDKVVKGRVGYLHEGFFSCVYAWQFGYSNCVARMGTHLSGYQEDCLVSWFDRLVIVPDGDEPGYRSADKIYESVKTRMSCEIATMPLGFEVDRLSESELQKVMGPPEMEVDSDVVAN